MLIWWRWASIGVVNVIRQKFSSPDVTAVRVSVEVLAARPSAVVSERLEEAASGSQLKPRPSVITIKTAICDYTAHSAEQR